MGKRTIMITGGGTGGHVNPGLALAQALTSIDPDVDIVWVGTRGRVEEHAVPSAGIPIEFLDVAYLKGRRGPALFAAAAKLPRSGLQAMKLLKKYEPAAVIGVGGFAAGPMCAVAAVRRVPMFVLEQNSVPGVTNRTLARLADTVYATFEQSRSSFGNALVKTLGNPVRADIVENAHRRRPRHPLAILVIGGSQGAKVLNLETGPLVKTLQDAGVPVTVTHAAGPGREDEVTEAYAAAGFEAVQVVPYIDDMASAYSNADFVITRAGATTLCELTAVGIPALYVPFAAAADDHQTQNALAVVEAGGGVMNDEDGYRDGRAARLLAPLLKHPEVLDRMASAAKRCGRPDAATRIASDILEQIA